MKRPSNINEFIQIMTHFRSTEAMEAVSRHLSQSDDVYISTFAKSGTTWMQQIVHQLRSGADESFDDIYQVVPWIESALDMNIDPSTSQAGLFRVFKSHLSYEKLPKTGRYITIFRDPAAVIPSWFRFFEGWLFETGSITMDEFANAFYFNKFNDHASHFGEWYKRIDKSDTLVLCYEDLIIAPDRVPALVADFLEVNLNSETMKRVVRNCSRQYMFEHRSKFEELYFRSHIDKVLELPGGGSSLKVNRSPTEKTLSDDVLKTLAFQWNSVVKPQLGFDGYGELRGAIPNLLNIERESLEPV